MMKMAKIATTLIFILLLLHCGSLYASPRIRFCGDVDPVTYALTGEKESFTTDEKTVTAFCELENIAGGERIRFSWLDPSGAPYGESIADIPLLPGGMKYPVYRAWNGIIIRTNRAAWLPGQWKVKVYLGSSEVTGASFTLQGTAGPAEKISPPYRTISAVRVQSGIYGRVIDAASLKPMTGAMVRSGNLKAVTSGGGLYLVSGIGPGEVKVRVQAPGYCETSYEGMLEPDTLQSLDLLMEKERTSSEPVGAVVTSDDVVFSGAYHVYEVMGRHLVGCLVTNYSKEQQKVFVSTAIDGLTALCNRTIAVPSGKSIMLTLTPTLIPGKLKDIHEAVRASVTTRVSYMKGEREIPVLKRTDSVTMLARDTLVYIEKNRYTARPEFLFYTLAAWITPHMKKIDEELRKAAEFHAEKKFVGYQARDIRLSLEELSAVPREQARAIYRMLQEDLKLTYANPSTEFGTDENLTLAQRSRLPGDILKDRSANCLESTVIFATLLEAAHLDPVIVILSAGHAFVGWEKWSNSGEYDFLKTTDIAKGLPFEKALEDGNSDYRDAHELLNNGKAIVLKIPDLRRRGILPME